MRPPISDHAILPALKAPLGVLVEEVVAGLPSVPMQLYDLVRLRLEATDAAVAYDAAEILAEQRRWERAKLVASGDPASVERLVARVLADHLAPEPQHRLADIQRRSQRVPRPRAAPAPAGSRAHRYLMLALDGRREEALAVVQEAVDAGATVAEVMLEVLTPAQIELGDQWESGAVSVAHEHYVTAITELALGLLHPRLFLDRIPRGLCAVTATSEQESHDLALRMVSDLLLQDGWHSVHLGCDVPAEDLVELTIQRNAAVLALSVSMPGHLRWFEAALERIRADDRLRGLRIIAGGRALDLVPSLAERLGADAYAADAAEAVQVCARWASESAAPPQTN